MSNPKNIVITGASSGIGAALAKQLSAQGHKLVLAARRKPELEAVAKPLGAVTIVTDMTKRVEVDRLREGALSALGHVDVWVNNAGVGMSRSVLDLTDADVDQIFAANLKSALYGMQTIVPHFKTRGRGQVINVSSFLSKVPLAPVRSIYSAAKAALNSLTANLRQELAVAFPEIQVSLVLPGLVATDFGKNSLGEAFRPPPAAVASRIPTQTADEVAAVIAKVIAEPRAEVYTNPPQQEIAVKYVQDPVAFEEQMRG